MSKRVVKPLVMWVDVPEELQELGMSILRRRAASSDIYGVWQRRYARSLASAAYMAGCCAAALQPQGGIYYPCTRGVRSGDILCASHKAVDER